MITSPEKSAKIIYKAIKSKKEITDWAYEQFDIYGVRKPETYTSEELKYLTPHVPSDIIDEPFSRSEAKAI